MYSSVAEPLMVDASSSLSVSVVPEVEDVCFPICERMR